MSAPTLTDVGATADVTVGAPVLGVSQRRVLLSEWTKFRSLRSTLWTLLVGIVLMIGLGALFAAVTASQYDTFSATNLRRFNAVGTSLTGVTFAQLAIGVLGVLLVTGEYSTGMIRSSLTAVPQRLPVLWGKMTVFAAVVFSLSLAGSAAAFFIGEALLSSHHLGVSITAPGALRSVIGAALYLTVAGLIAISLGTLMRNTAAGIATFVAVFFVIPPITDLLPSSVSDHLSPYLPSNVASALYDSAGLLHGALSPWTGFALLCGYAVVMAAAAAWGMLRRDA